MSKKELYLVALAGIGAMALPLLLDVLGIANNFIQSAVIFALLLGSHLALRHQIMTAHQRDLEEMSQRSVSQLIDAYENSGQGWFWQTDRHGKLRYISPQVAERLGERSERLVGMPMNTLVAAYNKEDDNKEARTLGYHLSSHTPFSDLTLKVSAEDDRWWSISGVPQHDELGNFCGFAGNGSDLTEIKKSRDEITQLARFDPLTKLANRSSMSEALDRALKGRKGRPGNCCVMLLDLDKFKQVNDTMGHPVGDALLQEVAERLSAIVGTTGKVGRLGGDEFEIILPDMTAQGEIEELAAGIIEHVSKPYNLATGQVRIGVSIGIMIILDKPIEASEVIRNADLALYEAKDAGRGVARFYDKSMLSKAAERRILEEDLREALTRDELYLVYQPVVEVATEKIAGFEVLTRWKHPVKGHVNPEKFFAIAEEAGLIEMIGDWTLRTACRQLAEWGGDLKMAVNVSPLQFTSGNLPSVVLNAIASSGIQPHQLELEITEGIFLEGDQATVEMFHTLKKIGVRLALDDFGTGYSALGYLQKAPFDKIKIDQSFVRGATLKNSINSAIIASIVALADDLGMDTTAEGAETHDELNLVRKLGCSHLQGYIYSKPLLPEDAAELLREGDGHMYAEGLQSTREPRRKVLHSVGLHHEDYVYPVNVKNISRGGAMVDGLQDVPVGTRFTIEFGGGFKIGCTARWSHEGRIGLEFDDMIDVSQVRKKADQSVRTGWVDQRKQALGL